MKVVKKSTLVFTHLFLGLGSIVMIYPFVFALLGMFVSPTSFLEMGILPRPESFQHFTDGLSSIFKYPGMGRSMVLTLARFFWYAIIVGATSIFGGYVFAKVNFAGKQIAFYILMSSMMIPGVALLIPQYLMFVQFPLVGGNDIWGRGGSGFTGNPAILFITGCFSAYNIFLVRQSLAGLGNEFKEAAEIDGAGFFRIVLTIYTPMLLPVLALMTIQCFIGQWNDYMFPTLFLAGNKELWPIGKWSVALQDNYLGSAPADYTRVMIMAMFMMLPPVIVYIAFQKYFVEGLTAGGVKS